MSKYFDKLMKMNENLTKELKKKGLFTEGEEEEMVSVPADSLSDDQTKKILADTIHDKVDPKVDDKTIDEISKDPVKASAVTDLLAEVEPKKESTDETDISKMDWEGPAIIKKEDPDGDTFYVKDDEWSSDIQDAYEFPGKEDAADKIGQLGGDYLFVLPATMKKEGLDESINESDGEVYLRMDDDDLDIHGYVQWENDKVNFTDNEQDADVFASKADAESAILDISDMFNYDPETFTTQEVDSQVSDNGDNWVSLDPTDATATTVA